MEGQLAKGPYLAGEEYTIADMMCFPWIKGGYHFIQRASPDRLPPLTEVRAWLDRIDAREAVKRAEARLASGH